MSLSARGGGVQGVGEVVEAVKVFHEVQRHMSHTACVYATQSCPAPTEVLKSRKALCLTVTSHLDEAEALFDGATYDEEVKTNLRGIFPWECLLACIVCAKSAPLTWPNNMMKCSLHVRTGGVEEC